MNITLYSNSSDNNVVTKTISQVASLSGSLRNESGIMSPSILIEGTYPSANYCYISDWGRYYFIEEIISVRNNISEIRCRIDTLMTYAQQIRGLTAIIKKQENDYNLYINDGSFMTYANDKVFTKGFPGSFSDDSYVLLVSGS